MAQELFRGAAWYYARFRPGYPAEIIDAIVERAQLDGGGRALDLGCGTGQLAVPLAAHVEEVVAVDSQPEMLAELRAVAPRNVTAVEARAEDLDEGWGSFRVATAGRSFHWMDQDHVLRRLRAVTPCVALTADSVEDFEPYSVVIQLAEDVTGRPRPPHAPYEPWAVTLRRGGFSDVVELVVPFEREWTVDRLLGWAHSTSFASPVVLGGRMDEFDRRVRERLEPLGEPLVERSKFEALIGLR